MDNIKKYDVNIKRLDFTKRQREKYPPIPFIHASVKIPEWVTLGKNVIIHEGCIIGTEGFGFEQDYNGEWLHIPHIGKLIIEDNVEIFHLTTINRGTVDNTVIGKGTKIDHHCHIGHNVTIGENCVITAGVIICGSTKLGNNVWIGVNSSIADHVSIGDNAIIGSHSNVLNSIGPDITVVGNPAKRILKRKTREEMYLKALK